MATFQQHLDQWKHNRAFLAIVPDEYPDWRVTVAFYSALHAVDAMLCSSGFAPNSHDDRNHMLATSRAYDFVWRHYRQLYNLSRLVRYTPDPSQWIPPAQVKPRVIDGLLRKIEEGVDRQVGTKNFA